MSQLVHVLRALIRDELRSLRMGDIAVVTSVYPRASDSDAANHVADVRLREGDLELSKVPICTPHIGMISTPRVDDLVLLQYLQGDPSRPIIVGRLYSDQATAPLHEADEWRVESPFEGRTSLAIDVEEALVFTAGDTVISVAQDGSIDIEGPEDINIKVNGNATLECVDCSIKASGKVALGDGGGGVITTTSHKCFYSGAPLVGSTTVTAKG